MSVGPVDNEVGDFGSAEGSDVVICDRAMVETSNVQTDRSTRNMPWIVQHTYARPTDSQGILSALGVNAPRCRPRRTESDIVLMVVCVWSTYVVRYGVAVRSPF